MALSSWRLGPDGRIRCGPVRFSIVPGDNDGHWYVMAVDDRGDLVPETDAWGWGPTPQAALDAAREQVEAERVHVFREAERVRRKKL